MFKRLSLLFLNTFMTILVLVYLILEELIWERIAEPIYEFIHSLKLLQKVEQRIHGLNRYALLAIFLLLFVVVEGLGFVAIALFAHGQALIATLIYAGKIPIAAFTFWLFRIAKDKLLTFGWFRYCYDGLQNFLHFIKTSTVYVGIKAKAHAVKEWLKGLGIKQLFIRLKTLLGFKPKTTENKKPDNS